MERDPVATNKQGYRPPSRLIQGHQQQQFASTPTPAGNGSGNNGVNNLQRTMMGSSTSGNGGNYHASSYSAAKRVKSNLNSSHVYRDGETTGFEEEGNDNAIAAATPWVNMSSRLTGGGMGQLGGKNGMTPLANKSNAMAGTVMRGHIEESTRTEPAKVVVYTVGMLSSFRVTVW
jgi:hypothetical protein